MKKKRINGAPEGDFAQGNQNILNYVLAGVMCIILLWCLANYQKIFEFVAKMKGKGNQTPPAPPTTANTTITPSNPTTPTAPQRRNVPFAKDASFVPAWGYGSPQNWHYSEVTKQVQTELERIGFNVQTDGFLGQETVGALKEFYRLTNRVYTGHAADHLATLKASPLL